MIIMKTKNAKTDTQKLAGVVQTARLQVETAESKWQAAKQQARAAKRRRKEVKLIAFRARQQAKEAKADLARTRKVLAEAEAKLAKSGIRLPTRKPAKAKARPAARRAVAAPKMKTTPVSAQAGVTSGQPDGGTPDPAVNAEFAVAPTM